MERRAVNMEYTLTTIIPALNEEDNLENTVACVLRVASQYFKKLEIIIFNDGSTDNTGKIADRLARENSNIKVVHHDSPRNLGRCYKEGIELATMNYVILVPGDNECAEGVIDRVLSLVGKADIIIPYTNNGHVRSFSRRFLSEGFVKVLNVISKCNLRYYNGTVLHRTDIIRSREISTEGFGYQAEALVGLIHQGFSYLEVATEITLRAKGKSKAVSIKNIIDILKFLANLAIQVRTPKTQLTTSVRPV